MGKVLLTLPIQVGCCTAIDGRIDKIVDNLAVVQPTFMGAAPRIFEKAYGRVKMMMEEEGGLKLKLFNWAGDVGREVSELREQGKNPSGLLAGKYAIADKIIMSKIRDRLGVGSASSSPARGAEPGCRPLVRRHGHAGR